MKAEDLNPDSLVYRFYFILFLHLMVFRFCLFSVLILFYISLLLSIMVNDPGF